MSHRTVRTLLLLVATCAAALVFPGASIGPQSRRPQRRSHPRPLGARASSQPEGQPGQARPGPRRPAQPRRVHGRDNPRDADTDNDGVPDGKEKAGQVASFTGGVLTVHLFNGDDVKGTVDADTEIECDDTATTPTTTAPAARAADDGGGDGGHHGGDNQGPGDDNQGDDDQGDDDERGQQAGCDVTKLTAGAVVSEAELRATPAGLVFEKIELVG